ncbi:MAG: hypothetical protein GX444_21590 [Myxococcales bacterium]|nr:hypothetical protein [Myxococcales bacterium]
MNPRYLWILTIFALFFAAIALNCSSSGDDDDNDDNDDNNDGADDDTSDDDAGTDDDDNDDNDNDTGDDDDNDDASPGSGDLIQNGGFETGDTTNWDGEWPYDQLVYSENPDDDTSPDDDEWYVTPHSGAYAAWFGQTFQQHTAWLGQTVSIPESLSAGTIDFWYYMSKFGSCTFTFTARVVEAANPDNTLIDLGTWTEADAAFLAKYKELNRVLTTDEMSALQGENAVLRFDYTGSGALISACYIYLDDVSLQATW